MAIIPKYQDQVKTEPLRLDRRSPQSFLDSDYGNLEALGQLGKGLENLSGAMGQHVLKTAEREQRTLAHDQITQAGIKVHGVITDIQARELGAAKGAKDEGNKTVRAIYDEHVKTLESPYAIDMFTANFKSLAAQAAARFNTHEVTEIRKLQVNNLKAESETLLSLASKAQLGGDPEQAEKNLTEIMYNTNELMLVSGVYPDSPMGKNLISNTTHANRARIATDLAANRPKEALEYVKLHKKDFKPGYVEEAMKEYDERVDDQYSTNRALAIFQSDISRTEMYKEVNKEENTDRRKLMRAELNRLISAKDSADTYELEKLVNDSYEIYYRDGNDKNVSPNLPRNILAGIRENYARSQAFDFDMSAAYVKYETLRKMALSDPSDFVEYINKESIGLRGVLTKEMWDDITGTRDSIVNKQRGQHTTDAKQMLNEAVEAVVKATDKDGERPGWSIRVRQVIQSRLDTASDEQQANIHGFMADTVDELVDEYHVKEQWGKVSGVDVHVEGLTPTSISEKPSASLIAKGVPPNAKKLRGGMNIKLYNTTTDPDTQEITRELVTVKSGYYHAGRQTIYSWDGTTLRAFPNITPEYIAEFGTFEKLRTSVPSPYGMTLLPSEYKE